MTDWNDIFIDNLVNINIDILYDKWISLFLSIIDSFIPSRMVTIRPRDKPWMNGVIRRAMNKRNRLLNNFSKNKSLFNWEKYRVQRNFVVSLIRKAKLDCDHKINEILSNPNT